MQKIELKLTPILYLFLTVASLFHCNILWAKSFDNRLEEIQKFHSEKKYEILLDRLKKLKASPELEDLRLFLQAESLKGLNRNQEALQIYNKIIRNFPRTEMAFQSQFPSFVLQLENASERDIIRLEALGQALPTSWQRGTALEKLAELDFVRTRLGMKSRIAIQALRAYYSDKPFYSSTTASHKLLDNILTNPQDWVFEDDEWLEILLKAKLENTVGKIFLSKISLAKLLGRWGLSTAELFRAESLREDGKIKSAIAIYNSVIASRKSSPAVVALAYQLRGDTYYFNKQYSEAVIDYRVALQTSNFPVNKIAATYRLMRSSWHIGNDVEAIELIGRLHQMGNAGALLPVHVYEMGLSCFDRGLTDRAIPYFILLARLFPGHYRADDALGYAIKAFGINSLDGRSLLDLLTRKYTNSFFIWWILPDLHSVPIRFSDKKIGKLNRTLKKRIGVVKKLWSSGFSDYAISEARKLTDQNPRNLPLFKTIIEIANKNNDYNQLTAYGERLARQLLEDNQSLDSMPKWAWEAMYPLAFEKEVRRNAKRFGIDPVWILSIMREESHFRDDTLSRSNAMGLMQILPSTGKWIAGRLGEKKFNKEKLWDIDINIRYGSWYLKFLYDMFKHDLHLASSAYNGGQGNVLRKVEQGPYSNRPVLDRLDKIPLSETRDYYKKVMGSYWNYSRLYD